MCPDSDDKFSWPEIVRGQFLDGLCTSGLVGHHLVTRTRTLSITMDNRGMNRGLLKKPGADDRPSDGPTVRLSIIISHGHGYRLESRPQRQKRASREEIPISTRPTTTRRLVDSSTRRLGRKRPSEPLCRVWRRISVESERHGFVHVVLRQPAGDGGGAGARAGRGRRHSAKVRVTQCRSLVDTTRQRRFPCLTAPHPPPPTPTLQRHPADGGSERSALGVSGGVAAD